MCSIACDRDESWPLAVYVRIGQVRYCSSKDDGPIVKIIYLDKLLHGVHDVTVRKF